jgi:hypothetical protein
MEYTAMAALPERFVRAISDGAGRRWERFPGEAAAKHRRCGFRRHAGNRVLDEAPFAAAACRPRSAR